MFDSLITPAKIALELTYEMDKWMFEVLQGLENQKAVYQINAQGGCSAYPSINVFRSAKFRAVAAVFLLLSYKI